MMVVSMSGRVIDSTHIHYNIALGQLGGVSCTDNSKINNA